MKKILAITGIRSDYGIMVPVFTAIEKHPDLTLELIVSGAHLSRAHGNTIQQIEKDGFTIVEKIENLIAGDNKSSRLNGLAIQLSGLCQAVSRIQPDLLMVLGDREESLTTAITGTYLDIPVVHLCGGDKVIGNVDDVVRHAVTKLSHLHLATNEESKERILKLGEQPSRVFNVGNPSLDRFRELPPLSRKEIFDYHQFSNDLFDQPFLIVVQHVLSSEQEDSYRQMKETMEAIKELKWPTLIIYPNSDPGNYELISCINEYQDLDFIKISRNVPTLEFCNSLRHAACLIGNSSLGLLEAPFLKLPAINVGNRQKGRLHGANLVFEEHDRNKIIQKIKEICLEADFKEMLEHADCPYGDGKSARKIVEILANITINNDFLIKDITY